MKKNRSLRMLSLLLTLAMVLGMIPGALAAGTQAGQYADVPANYWAADAVNFVTEKGLFGGTDSNKFSPSATMTRSMAATVLHRMAGEPSGTASFTDVAKDAWYADAVAWAASNCIMVGTGSTFSPDAPATRETLAGALYQYAQAKTTGDWLSSFSDAASVSDAARDAMNWAVASGLMTGKDNGRLDPAGNITRAEVATLMMRFVPRFGAGVAAISATAITDAITQTVAVDPANPLCTELNGLYSVELEGGRVLYHYVPASLGYRQPAVAIGVPSGIDASRFMQYTGWKAVADERGISLILMVPGENGWTADESKYVEAAFDYMDDRTYLQMQDSAFYMVGYEDSANAVMAFSTQYSELMSGFAAFGVDKFDTTILETAKKTESNAAGVMKSEVAVPMWIGAAARTTSVDALVDFWKNANNCDDAVTSNAYADAIYQSPAYLANTNEITYANCAKVMVTIGLTDVETPDFTQNLYNNFLMRTRRQDSGDINALRPFATNEEKSMEHKTLVVDGTTREFWVYVPTAVASGKVTNVPVVFAFHGGGGSGEEFAARSGWDKLAEERNFIAVFPTGHRSNDKFKASTTWGAEDLPFFESMRADILKNYSVDSTRVYVSGQSMGCVMSVTIAVSRPDLIAACAATSARQMHNDVANPNTSILMPFMWSVGEKDQYFVEGGKDYGLVPACIAEWRERYGITADESNTYTYQNGNFHGYDFKNVDGVTLVREQWVTDKIHAMLPDEVYTLYDFMSCYSRGADGTSYYMGVAISPKCN